MDNTSSVPCGILLALLDGAVDEPIPELGGKTPLEVARKPFIDGVASSFMGYTESRNHTHEFLLELLTRGGEVARGVLEALALGIPMRKGEAVYRLSPARLASGIRLEYRLKGGEVKKLEECAEHALKIIDEFEPRLYFYGYRGLLVLREAPSGVVHSSPFEGDPLSLPERLRKFMISLSSENDGLTLLPWGGGIVRELELKPRLERLSIASKSPAALGLAKLIKAKILPMEDLPELVGEVLQDGNLLIHFDRPDEESHMLSYTRKVLSIEEADTLLAEVSCHGRFNRVAILVDHGTSSITGRHFRVKVPFACYNGVTRRKRIFYEREVGRFVPLGKLLEVILDGCQS